MDTQSILIAKKMINIAKENNFIDGNNFNTIEDLAEVERDFFINLVKELEAKIKNRETQELNLDEISSLFSFVFGKSAEAVTNFANQSKQHFDYLGLLDGKVPVYVDESLLAELKTSKIPSTLAKEFIDFPELSLDPKLALFEALKWTWRIGQNFAINFLEC